MDVRLDDVAQAVENVRQAAWLFLQVDLAALNAAHVQHVVDEAQKVVAGGHDLFEIPRHLLLLVNVGGGQGREADDGVHRCADVVGHVGEEHALGFAGPVGLGERVLQQGLLLHLGPGFLVHAAKTHHHAALVAPIPGANGFHLEKA